MPIIYSVLVYRQTAYTDSQVDDPHGPGASSMSVLRSQRFASRVEAEAFARTQEGGELKATVHPLCDNGVHPIGQTDDGVDFCQQCDRKRHS